MQECKPTLTPMPTGEKIVREDVEEKISEENYKSVVGSLIYLTNNRPDIEHPVSITSRFVSEPSSTHMKAVKCIMRSRKGEERLIDYSDNDWAGSAADRESTRGFVFQIGKKVSWNSRKQKSIDLSSAEAGLCG